MRKDKIKELIGRSLYAFNTKIDKKISENDYRNKQQDHKINALIGNIDDNFITKEDDENIVSLENSIDGALTVEAIEGNTKYVRKNGTVVDTFEQGVSLKSFGGKEGGNHKISILSQNGNSNLIPNSTDLKVYNYASDTGNKQVQFLDENGEKFVRITCNQESSSNLYFWLRTIIARKRGVTYTLSCDYRCSKNWSGYWYPSETYAGNWFPSTNNNWLRTSVTRKVDNDSNGNMLFGVNCARLNIGDYIDIKNVKMEIGETATQWIPSINDEEFNSIKYSDKKEILIKEPLRGLGNGVRDSIENLKLTRRIGTRPYQDGDESNSKVLTDKVTTLYQLENPIIEDIDIGQSTLLLKCFEKGTLFIEDDIPVGNVKVRYDASIPMKNNTIQNKRYTEFVGKDINDSVFPTLMDLNYRCICIQLTLGKDISDKLLLLSDSYKILKRDILSKRLSNDEYLYRLHDYLQVKRITQEQYEELKEMIK